MKHYLDPYLMRPEHPITVLVIGCGGTGSYVVSQLAKISVALKELRDIELDVCVADDDIVESHNIGRQMFSESDIGHYKSNVIVNRVNRYFGLDWESNTERIEKIHGFNIVISCVDNIKTRKIIAKTRSKKFNKEVEPYRKRLYWLDFGNSKNYGQYVLSTFDNIEQPSVRNIKHFLPNVFELFGKMKEDKSEPSCSMMESLNQQDLFINLQLATAGINLLWKLLKDHVITYQGQFINTDSGESKPIKI